MRLQYRKKGSSNFTPLEIGEGGVWGENCFGTPDGPYMECSYDLDPIQNDVWFSFVAPENGNLTISVTADFNNSIFYPQLQILDGCGGVPVGCDDDGSDTPFDSTIELACGDYIPGHTYLVQIDGNSGTDGVFKLSVITDGVNCANTTCPDI